MSLTSLTRVNLSLIRSLTTSTLVRSSDKGCGISEKQAEILKQKTPIGIKCQNKSRLLEDQPLEP